MSDVIMEMIVAMTGAPFENGVGGRIAEDHIGSAGIPGFGCEAQQLARSRLQQALDDCTGRSGKAFNADKRAKGRSPNHEVRQPCPLHPTEVNIAAGSVKTIDCDPINDSADRDELGAAAGI